MADPGQREVVGRERVHEQRDDVAEDVDGLQERPDRGTERPERQELLDELRAAHGGGLVGERVLAGDDGQQGVAGDLPGGGRDAVDDEVGEEVGDLEVAVDGDGLLLHDVGRLVRHELEVRGRLPLAEEDVGPDGEGTRVQLGGGGAHLGALVHADGAEVGAEVRLDLRLDRGVHRRSGTGAGDERGDGRGDLDVPARGDVVGGRRGVVPGHDDPCDGGLREIGPRAAGGGAPCAIRDATASASRSAGSFGCETASVERASRLPPVPTRFARAAPPSRASLAMPALDVGALPRAAVGGGPGRGPSSPAP